MEEKLSERRHMRKRPKDTFRWIYKRGKEINQIKRKRTSEEKR